MQFVNKRTFMGLLTLNCQLRAIEDQDENQEQDSTNDFPNFPAERPPLC